MAITIEWQKPILLAKNNKPLFDDKNIPEEIDKISGVYFFARWFGENVTPFYIGSSLNIRLRLCQHLKERIFWEILEGRTVNNFELDKGYKYFHFGYFRGKGKQDPKKCIIAIEKQMIHQKIQEGVHLLNQRGTFIPTYTIQFAGNPDGFSSFAKNTEIVGKYGN